MIRDTQQGHPQEGAVQAKRKTHAILVGLALILGMVGPVLAADLPTANPVSAERTAPAPPVRHKVIPILGVTLNDEGQPMGVVVAVNLELETRADHEGLYVRFHSSPGRFSAWSQRAVKQAILRSGHAAGLRPDSWSVTLTFPYQGITLYGDSLSAMVGLSIVALVKEDPLLTDCVMTGTVTAQGQIGLVGGVPYKIQAAYFSQFRRVLIPETYDVADGDWHTPFLMQVSPVGTLSKAYYGLTGHPLHTPQLPRAPLVALLP